MAGLAVTLGADSRPFEAGMKAALNVAGQTAAQIGAKWAVAATGIDKVMAQTARNVGVTFGRELAGKLTPAALGIVGAVAGFLALQHAVSAVGDAAKEAQERLAALVKIGADARGAGVGTTFLQSLTGQAKALNTEVSTLTGMLEHARDASTVRIGEGSAEATSSILDRLRQNVTAGNLGKVDLDRFTNADSQESRIRIILDLLDQLRAKGANLAAFDLARTMFGAEFEQKLRTGTDMVTAMRRALDGLKAGDQGRIIPPEEIQRAENLNRRIEEANRLISDGLAPIQRDIALWQQQQLAGWVDIKEQIAAAAQFAGKLYEWVSSIGQSISALGNSQIFKSLRDALDSVGMIDKGEVARIERMLNGGLEAGDNRTSPKDADAGGPLNISVRPRADTSRSLPSLTPKAKAPSTSDINQVETFVNSLEKSAAAIRAEADAYGKSNAERQIAIELAKAEEIAKANGLQVTDAETARIRIAATATAEYRQKLEDLRDSQEFFRSAGGEFLTGIAQDARNGVGALEALNNALQRLAARLEDKALNSLADLLFGRSGGNNMGLFGGIFGSGTLGGLGGVNLGLDFMPHFASGVTSLGMIEGAGTGTSDSILAIGPSGPIRVSDGESIVNADATRQYRPFIEAMNAGRMPRFSSGGFTGTRLFGPDVVEAFARSEQALSRRPTRTLGSAAGALSDMRGAGGDFTVNVHPPTGTVPEVQKKNTPTGMSAEVMIRQAIGSDLESNGPLAQAIQGMYGLNRMSGRQT